MCARSRRRQSGAVNLPTSVTYSTWSAERPSSFLNVILTSDCIYSNGSSSKQCHKTRVTESIQERTPSIENGGVYRVSILHYVISIGGRGSRNYLVLTITVRHSWLWETLSVIRRIVSFSIHGILVGSPDTRQQSESVSPDLGGLGVHQ